MSRRSRLPVAAACFGMGVAGALFATDQLLGQSSTPLPPPPGQALPLPAALPAPEVAPSRPDPASYRDVVKRVLPAVVNIDAKAEKKTTAAKAQQGNRLPPGVNEEFRRYFDQQTPPPDGDLGVGSGVVIDPAGVVLTNYHVVEGADSVEVTLQDGRKFTTKDIRTDQKTDLAVVVLTSVVKESLPSLPLGDSDGMEVGDRVLAVGAPFGLAGSVTHGIVSAKSRQNLRLNQYEDFLQTDAAINPGNSGGPLVNLDGQVIGINSAIKTRGGGFQGVGLAISSNLARDVVSQLLKDGVVRRGYVGVGIRHLDAALAARLGVATDAGVVVSKVYDNSPAARAGVMTGDLITAVAGTPVKDVPTLPRVVAKLPIGQVTQLTVLRDGKTLAVTMPVEGQPEERTAAKPAEATPAPSPAPRAASVTALGLEVSNFTLGLAAQFGYPQTVRGAVVTAVERGGRADEAGITRGRLIVKVDRTAVTSAQSFLDAIAAASPDRGALVQMLRPSGEVDFAVLRVK
jgi:serine protease Do